MTKTPHLTHRPDAFERADRLRGAYLDYLRDALPIHPTQEKVQALYDEEIRKDGGFSQPPLLSLTPRFQPSCSLRGLVKEGALSPKILGLDADRFPAERPLYEHQATAIRGIASGRNAVVATGTGSGKTECFLLPVLDDALRHPESGVRTLLIYPMNALANDQLQRMREVVGGSGIRFGRYTGETPHTEEDLPPLGSGACPTEARSREAIRERPPQVLLTNFAMLEYLLLRPDDQEIFCGGELRTVVLDEAHTYDGVQGIDVGLLMRRLQQRFRDKIHFVLTSATLGDAGPAGDAEVAEFAHRLTGGRFEAADVVRGVELRDLAPADATQPLPAEAARIADAGPGDGGSAAWLQTFGAECDAPTALRADPLVVALVGRLRESPRSIEDLAEQLGEPQGRVRNRLRLLAAFKDPETGGPLVSLRLHQFFRGPSGVSVSLAASTEPWPAERLAAGACVSALRVEQAAAAPEGEEEAVFYPLLCCNACGMLALDGALSAGNRFVPRTPTTTAEDARTLSWMPLDEEAEDSAASDGPGGEGSRVWIHALTGGYAAMKPEDLRGRLPLERVRLDDHGRVSTCPRCGATKGRYESAFRSFRVGEDGPTAVLAEEMLADIAGRPGAEETLPAGGRQLLAFSDSRQRAAFFAPYLNRTSRDASEVQPLVQAARRLQEQEGGDPAGLEEVVQEAARIACKRAFVVLPSEDGIQQLKGRDDLVSTHRRAVRDQLLKLAFRHLCATPSQRLRLPALRLAFPRFELSSKESKRFTQSVERLLPDETLHEPLLQRTLHLMIQRFAIALPGRLTPASLMNLDRGPSSVAFHLSRSEKGVHATVRFNPWHADLRYRKQAVRLSRTAQLARQALPGGGDGAWKALLEAVWEGLHSPGSSDEGVFQSRGDSGGVRVNPDRLQLETRGPWHACGRCGAVARFPLGDACPVFGCGGRLSPVEEGQAAGRDARVRERYTREPLLLEAQEHTAQLTLARGRDVQQGFVDGRVNVLSCSTTFEMGIDVGDLDAVLLRNVPPGAANYAQRVGRAGRRSQSVAHAAVYAGARPHDQHFFHAPAKIAAGRVRVPRVWLRNEVLFQRHVNSYLLGRHWREAGLPPKLLAVFNPDDAREDRVGFLPESAETRDSPAHRFAAWCCGERATLEEAIRTFTPADLNVDASDLLDASAAGLLPVDGSEGGVSACERSVWPRLREWEEQGRDIDEKIEEAVAEKDYAAAGRLGNVKPSLERLSREYRVEGLINLLAFEHWLPNFAFPQDTTRLRVVADELDKRLRLERPRERSIAEYAPGSEVIVDGMSIEVGGLDLLQRSPDLQLYKIDPKRQIVVHCGSRVRGEKPRRGEQAVFQPRGYVTRFGESPGEPDVFRSPPGRVSPAFLVRGSEEGAFAPAAFLRGVRLALKRDTRILRLNLGRDKQRGFDLCMSCGAEVAHREKEHTAHWGAPCRGFVVRNIALCDELHSDVLQLRFGTAAPGFSPEEPAWHTLSAAVARAACDHLHVKAGDLRCGFRDQPDTPGAGELFLYDTVPGGAGYVERIEAELSGVLRRAASLLSSCDNADCTPEGSCYACLRSSDNQFEWQHLRRSAGLEVLRASGVRIEAPVDYPA